MKPVIVVNPLRADAAVVAELGELGVATVHEAAGKAGLLGTTLRQAFHTGPRAPRSPCCAGRATTSWCTRPWSRLRPGDLLVVTTTSPSSDGFIGELIVTSLQSRGVTGLVTTTGVRDVAAITGAAFPVWSEHVSAQGTLKATAGCVNVPIVVGGVVVHPGDAVVADDDGVVCIPRARAAEVAAAPGSGCSARPRPGRRSLRESSAWTGTICARCWTGSVSSACHRAGGGGHVTDDVALLDALRAPSATASSPGSGWSRWTCATVRRQQVRRARRDPVLASEGLVELQRHRGAGSGSSRSRKRSRSPRYGDCSKASPRPAPRAGHPVPGRRAGADHRGDARRGGRRRAAPLQRGQRPAARPDTVIAAHGTATAILGRLRAQMVRHQFALSLAPGGQRCHWPSTSASPRRSPPGRGRGRHAGPHHQRHRRARNLPPDRRRTWAGVETQQAPGMSCHDRRPPTAPAERCRDIAHVSAVELRSAVPGRPWISSCGCWACPRSPGGAAHRPEAWDDYERFTVCVTGGETSGIGRTWMRAASPAALQRRVAGHRGGGRGTGWADAQQGIGRRMSSPTPTATRWRSTGKPSGTRRRRGSARR